MPTNHKSKRRTRARTAVNFRAEPDLIARYRRLAEQEERTLSQALRRHMQSAVEQAEQEAQAA